MEFLIFLALVFISVKLLSAMMDNYKHNKLPKECVGVHEWIYVKDKDYEVERLKCKQCGKYPGVENGRTEQDVY